MKPRTKAPKAEQLGGPLTGTLDQYIREGLLQRPVNSRSVYRYRGVLLLYQKSLGGAPPSLTASQKFLLQLRKGKYSPSTIRIYRAVLKGFHEWRGEKLVFANKVPRHQPSYYGQEVVNKLLEATRPNPRNHLILRLMTDAGLRRGEIVNLCVKNVGDKTLRFRGKGDKDRTVPMTSELAAAIEPFCAGKGQNDSVVEVKDTAIYRTVKKYGELIGKPELKPHDLRHAFAQRLLDNGENIRVVQELLGHENLGTTQVYLSVAGHHLEEAIGRLNQKSEKNIARSESHNLNEVPKEPIPQARTSETENNPQKLICKASPDNVDVRILRKWGVPKKKAPELLRQWSRFHNRGEHEICSLFHGLEMDLTTRKIPFKVAESILQTSINAVESGIEHALVLTRLSRMYRQWDNIHNSKIFSQELDKLIKNIPDFKKY